jgi:X breakpoint 2-interacting protein
MRTVLPFTVILNLVKQFSVKARMTQLQDAQKGAEVTSEVTERELELEAQLVEARSIIQEQVCAV